jgi:molybdenum cofactor synthesis domain-containing protein
MITVDQALEIILSGVAALGTQTIPLEQAHGRILAQDVVADMDLPPFDRARMDGYALRSNNASMVPVSLKVIGEIAAGAAYDGRIETGEAIKIFTGAPVPDGADAVQKVEVTESDGVSVIIKEPVKAGQFITPRASEITRGEIVARSGRQIKAAEMAVLASFGYAEVKVFQKPKVGVISTGSELVAVSEHPSAAQIRNSNSYSIAAYAQRAGAEVDNLGTVIDTPEATREALLKAFEERDVVITSGGVSMGDYDLVKATLLEIGAEIFFDKVSIRPGKPTVFARRKQTWFFGLPGNPVSTSVTFNVFARTALRRLQGDAEPLLPSVQAELASAIKDASSRRSYLPAKLSVKQGHAIVEPLKWVGSSDLVAFMNANALIIVREETREIGAGRLVEVLLLNEQ